MRRFRSNRRGDIRAIAATSLVLLTVISSRASAQGPQDPNPASAAPELADLHLTHSSGVAVSNGGDELRVLTARVERIARWALAWYRRTPPADRVTWGGMIACAALGALVVLERAVRLRRRKIVPPAFTARFMDRLHDGKLDCGQALDHCELNPSPAARVALAAVRRWGRPAADLERAVALAHRVETERLRRNVGSLRRIAVLTPLLGLLGTLFALGRALENLPAAAVQAYGNGLSAATAPGFAWGPALAGALTPLCAGIVIATLSLVAYDGLLIRIEKLAGGLDRLGAETIDAIAMAAPVSIPTLALAPGEPRHASLRPDTGRAGSSSSARSPHQPYFRLDDRTGMIRHDGEHGIGS
jgi:biopolymer transport protein ExbB